MKNYVTLLREAVRALQEKIPGDVETGVILGSGMGRLAEEVSDKIVIRYTDIPGFPESTIPGHKGELVYGKFGGKKVLLFNGRYHYYQGFSLPEVTLPVRVAKRLGLTTLIITNASGGINTNLRPGDIMLIRDHINFMGANPLMGIDTKYFGTPFVDMTEPYDLALLAKVKELALRDPEIGELEEGVYGAVSGPSYETKAEIAFLSRSGADAVGMSTVPEVIVCSQEKIRVLGISAIVNCTAGIRGGKLSHDEVLDVAGKMSSRLIRLIREIIKNVL